MSVVTTGTLALENGQVESWQSGGEIGYTITGGQYRDVTPTGERWPHHRWTARFRRNGRTLQIGYMTGIGRLGHPDATDMLASAFSDASSVEFDNFEGWARDMGYDREEYETWKRAERIYRACERMSNRLESFFGSSRQEWAEALQDR